ncbi:conjugal transfer protein TraV [Sphingomonas sp. GC_Shp_6]|uniref:conjugal transfer protein TraV n=2 Tax=unclassified Sphingomonas TaxID=196159 RepID=UPI00226AFB50|nr:conjugal transfer protein TraV [Sphingomonas sp. GC_Shp_6]
MRRQLRILAPLSLATVLAGCMTMGGTVKGNFACKAPEGVCAPSSTIDDRALAMIVDASGTTGDRPIAPAGPYTAPRTVEPRFQQTALDTTRTGERVLRIVFPAQIDGAGRLHEQTAVHAVVEQGDWRQASAENLVATSREQVASVTGGETLLAAVVRGDPPITDDVQPDANMPTPAAVAAARAKGTASRQASADPIGDIKDQVARRVSAHPRPQRVSYSRAANPAPTQVAPPAALSTAPTAASATTSSGPSPARNTTALATPSAPPARPVAPTGAGTIVPVRATAAGRAAISAVNANPAIAAGLARAEPDARLAAKGADPLPVLHAAPLPGVEQ